MTQDELPSKQKPKTKPRRQPAREPSPVDAFDTTDPGDATQQNFRYQHAYGVMLLVSGKLGLRPYVTIWCEHHEDYLDERNDKKFDAYQIKTSKPENGARIPRDLALIKTYRLIVI